MAIVRSTQYPGRWNVPDSNSPQGSGKNRTSPTSSDGSYFDEVWFNDLDSLHQALFIASGIVPNGAPDTGTASQIFDALLNNRWSAIGNYSVGTIVTASNGKQYYCNQASGRDTSPIDPTVDSLDNWREYPYESITNAQGNAKKWFNGDLEVEGVKQSSSYTAPSPVTVPVTFPMAFSSPPNVTPALQGGLDSGGASACTAEANTNTGFSFVFSSSSSIPFAFNYTAKGRWS